MNQIQTILRREQTAEQIRQKIRQNSGPGYSTTGNKTGAGNPAAGTAGARPTGTGAAAGTRPGGAAAGGTVKTTANPTGKAKTKKKRPVEGMVVAGFVCMLLCFALIEDDMLVGPAVVLTLLALIFTICGRGKIEQGRKRGEKLALVTLFAAAPIFGISVPGAGGLIIWLLIIVASVLLYRKAAGKTIGKKKR